MGPREIRYGSVSIVNQLYGPAPFVFDPHEDDAGTVTGRQLLVGLVPFYQNYVAAMPAEIVVSPHRKFLSVLLAVRSGERNSDNPANIPSRQPTLLVVVVAVQFPALVLKIQIR